jgi:hypothetical protein
MTYSTYFEIGGHVIESIVEPRPGVESRPRKDFVEHYISEEFHVPKKLTKTAAKQVSVETGYDPQRAMQGAARARRAKWAFTTAATLALADGPIPVGDMAAIVFLGIYGSYEIVTAVGDIVQR